MGISIRYAVAGVVAAVVIAPLSITVVPSSAAPSTAAPASMCQIGPIRGATSPEGAVANVTMSNNGTPCVIPNYGLPAERANPAESGRITKSPRNGTATFTPPNATYVPNRGFAGEDEFEYEATAKGPGNRTIQLRVLVKVTVRAAGAAIPDQRFPDVVDVKVRARGANTFDFDVTISSPYDTPQRYADAFRVISADGRVYGERKLLHDHADEQPFTRDLYGVTIPAGVRTVVVQARDLRNGYGGKTMNVALPGR